MSTSAGQEHVHAVVVGSGFGGSVAAYRFAEAGRSVVLLERGKRYPPGGFARTPAEMGRNFWDPSEGLQGLFDIWSFEGLDSVVSSGLGGGSLIYANVLLRKDERWFVHESPVPGGGYENWPIGRADLDPHYEAVERMLGATPYPYENTTAKTMAMRDSAERLGLGFQLPPLAVTFAPGAGQPATPGAPIEPGPYGNIHGLPRRTCRLCGECDIGCNDGAKNTLDHTYLSAAAHHGADLRTLSEVRGFSPLTGGGFEVRYVVHDPAAEGGKTATRELPFQVITCDRLILGAGTFGSTFLLLRNGFALPGLSRTLGTRFSGNGDLLTFLFNAKRADGSRRRLDGSHGPVITSAIRTADEVDGGNGRGFYIEDAGYPMVAAWMAETVQFPGSVRRGARLALARLLALWRGRLGKSTESQISQSISALLGPGALSDSSLPLLGMGRDVPDGVMRLRDGRLAVGWTTATSTEYFDSVRDTMRAIAYELGADYFDNPLWRLRRVITVHPLGGAPMGRHPGEGTCDEFGEVFGFPGLHVLDGSLMPGPVGANPSLTIAATADRACDHMLSATTGTAAAARKRVNWTATAAPIRETPGGATSLAFTEEMKGFVALAEEDPATAADLGRYRDQRLMFRLTITVDDVDRFVADAEHTGRAEGYVDCDLLGGRLWVVRGSFNLFTRDGDPGRRLMRYQMHLKDQAGTAWTFMGHKEIRDDSGFDVWRDTSTLYVRILEGHVPTGGEGDARTVCSGVITIHLPDFAEQLASFRVDGPQPAQALQAFGRLFLGELWNVYGSRMMQRVLA